MEVLDAVGNLSYPPYTIRPLIEAWMMSPTAMRSILTAGSYLVAPRKAYR